MILLNNKQYIFEHRRNLLLANFMGNNPFTESFGLDIL